MLLLLLILTLMLLLVMFLIAAILRLTTISQTVSVCVCVCVLDSISCTLISAQVYSKEAQLLLLSAQCAWWAPKSWERERCANAAMRRRQCASVLRLRFHAARWAGCDESQLDDLTIPQSLLLIVIVSPTWAFCKKKTAQLSQSSTQLRASYS